MTQTRILTVADLINELYALNSPGARVNVTVQVDDIQGTEFKTNQATFDGPAEEVEKVFLEGEGPAVRIIAHHGVQL